MTIRLLREIPARKETHVVEWYRREFLRYTEEFRNVRANARDKFDRCFWCKHLFQDSEMFGLAHFVGLRGNKVLCGKCVDLIEAAEKQSLSEETSPQNDHAEGLSEELLNAPVAFGLKAQGKLERIEAMLKMGHLWPDIAVAIGWCPGTARCHYELASGDAETKELRAAVATAIEMIRELTLKYKDRMTVSERNACASAYCRGNRLLSSKTLASFP
jgi:uncharacterized CHY-type Zn-finger protein